MTDQEPAETTLYENGTILSLDNESDCHEALVTRGGKVLGTGSRQDMNSLAGPAATRVNLDGACALPGIIDSHPHAMHFMAYRIGAVDLLDATCFNDVIKAIQARAAVTPKGEWIMCTPIGEAHYFIRRDYTALAERRMPDRQVLDQAAPDHPVHIMAWAPKTPNICAFNSPGLKKLGIGPQIPDQVCEVYFDKDGAGLPTGVLRGKVNNYYSDDPYWYALSSRLPGFPDDLWTLAGIAGIQEYNAMGVTGMYEAHAMMPPHIEAYNAIHEMGMCTSRLVMSLELSGYAFSTPNYTDEEVWQLLELGHAIKNVDGERVRTNGVTLSRGGPLSQGFLRMHDHYPGPDGLPTRGHTFFPRALERGVVEYCIENDVRLNMMIGGYRDHDDFLTTLKETTTPEKIAEREWVLQHCYFTSPAQLEAYRSYNFHITSSASFVYGKADRVKEMFSESMARDFVAMRRIVDAGINFACGSDWGPDNPWRQMALNETREGAATGHHYTESGNQLTRIQSLKAFTRNGAAVMQWDGIGRLHAGSAADIVVVDRNPLTCPVEDLADTTVLRTILAGQGVYDAGGLKGGPLNLPRPAADL